MRYADVWPLYAKDWDAMIINANRVDGFMAEAEYAVKNKDIYSLIASAFTKRINSAFVSSPLTFPWAMIACIHRREGSGNFSTYLGNGQPLSQVTTITPKGRGPFVGTNAFIAGGIDAINEEDWGNVLDWRLEKQLYYMMLFNGAGYEMRGLPSPYIWGGTNIQKPGKYVADDVFNATEIDPQPGCAPLLACIAKLDPTVTFTRES